MHWTSRSALHAAALVAALFAGLIATVGALAQDMPTAPACFDQWVGHVGSVLNAYSGNSDFNSRKAWTINQYGVFVGRGISSSGAPDNWTALGGTRNQWMWNSYTSEAEYPDWGNPNFNGAGLKGLRWFVRNCAGTQAAATTLPTSPPPLAGPVSPAPGIALDSSAACPGNFSMHAGSTLIMICYCGAGQFGGTVWGTGIYTHDSALCAAALHAGAVGPGGGTVVVQGAPGQDAYQGTQSNGISSANYGSFNWSYVFPGTATPPVVTPTAAACPSNLVDKRGTGSTLTCNCAPGSMTGSVWGTGTYTDDSSICAAALHAGAVSPSGGTVTVSTAPGLTGYDGSARNGITSAGYGSWGGSFTFAGVPIVSGGPACPYNMTDLRGTSTARTCSCAPEAITGSVWGAGPYTDDSSICRAALHAGVIGASGGTVTAVAAPGLAAYEASTRNGVSSSSWGSWPGSFYFP